MLLIGDSRHALFACRVYYGPHSSKTKKDYFGDLRDAAKEGGFQPECVLFDGLYRSLKMLIKYKGFAFTKVREFVRILAST